MDTQDKSKEQLKQEIADLKKQLMNFQDLIQKKEKVEEKLKESEKIKSTLLEQAPVCNKIIDSDSKLQYMSNEGILRLSIPNVNLLYGTTYPSRSYPESIRMPWAKGLEKAQQGNISKFIAPLPDANGSLVWWKTTFIPIFNDKGNINFILGTSIDITEEKKSEEELLNYKNNLENIVEERTKELQEKNEELERYNKLFVGREFRIKELKDKLKNLEDKMTSD